MAPFILHNTDQSSCPLCTKTASKHDASTSMLHVLFWIIRMLSGKLQTGLDKYWFKKGDTPGQSLEECIPTYAGIDCIYHLGLDSNQNGITIKRLSLKKRPRVAFNNGENPQIGQWHSAESVSLSGRNDTRSMDRTSAPKGKPPLPPPHCSLLDSKSTKTVSPGTSRKLPESIPRQRDRYSSSQNKNPMIDQIIVETNKHFNQDVSSQSPPQPLPRRRLASFGGMSTPGSLSPFTGLGAYNQNSEPASDMSIHLSSSLGSRGSTGCLRLSPQSSGKTTPVTSLGSMQLQHVRDQMVVALEKLKELEEQVKIIPILHVKISVLQEEKRQLVLQLINQSDNEDMTCKKSSFMEKSDTKKKVSKDSEPKDDQDVCTDFREFKKLSEEMQALERTIKNGHLQAWSEKSCSLLQDKASKSIAVGTDIPVNVDITVSKTSKESKYTFTDQIETKSIATEVTEVHLGLYSKQEVELEAQQVVNGALRERIHQLEAELKESALQTELIRLKLELQVAGTRNRVDKACLARPATVSMGTETKLSSNSKRVYNDVELRDASTGETIQVKSVGVSCEPTMKNTCTGPDMPNSHWDVKERVETRDKAVGIEVPTRTQGTGTESINMTVCEAKQQVSQCFTTNLARGVDLGIMASPQTASQLTNTVCSTVSRFTNTSQAFSNNSSTNTLLSKQDKHTNTTHTFTRTVSVGNKIQGFTCTTETRSIGVDTANLAEGTLKQMPETGNKVTRDCGVGFTSIYENFLVGLKTRNMASGPSRLPDPIKTKSIGVGEGRIWDTSVSSDLPRQKFQHSTQFQWDLELNHYIEKMHRLLKEHGDLLTGESNINLLSIPETLVSSCKSGIQCSGSNQLDGNESEVKRMIKMLEQQSDSTVQDRSNVLKPWSAMKKQSGDQCCGSNRKSMKFLKVTTGLDPVSAYENEEEPRRDHQTFSNISQDGIQIKKGKDVSKRGSKGSSKLYRQQRCKLSEKIYSACQTLKMHLDENTALSSREMV
ncbi:KN motif and ankyrin repeat domain-containing protein 1-like [Nematolebias whitei]|uniref:KN motif and ankyrin repeat domain-containing protein 1-like n=1 Tax=Nematolebias whitei TaxID=451745 RepID=UPI00189851AA|nr:KN motif and ankyrin repeat domain-containing protein 1-like [Nematolebias whitei]